MIHPSKEAAKEVLKKFAASVKANEFLQDIGNEAHVWGIGKSVAFRKGIYTVYISTVPNESSEGGEITDPTALPRETKYNKEFARIVAKVLKDL